MILTVTMNPSIDISYPLEQFKLDTVNRVENASKTPGGKGLNVTRVLSQLNEDVTASGLLGGKIGEYLAEGLDEAGIKHSFFSIEGETRNCIAILHEGNQTEILEQGPTISQEESERFLDFFSSSLETVDIVSISGSLPKGISSDFYSKMVKISNEKNIPVVLDCSGEALLKVLEGDDKPTVIKPNTEELSQLLGVEVTEDVESLKNTLSKELFQGIEWVIVSLGAKGAFAKHNDKFYRVEIPSITVVNPVGSGDSTVAGITSALVNKEDDASLLKKANTLGMLNAQEALTGHVNLDNYDNLYNQIKVVEV